MAHIDAGKTTTNYRIPIWNCSHFITDFCKCFIKLQNSYMELQLLVVVLLVEVFVNYRIPIWNFIYLYMKL